MIEYLIMIESGKGEILNKNVELFLGSYKILSPDARITFEVELIKKMEGMDERTKRLYTALLQSAKDGLDKDTAIKQMRKVG